jgi:hypothetical protein
LSGGVAGGLHRSESSLAVTAMAGGPSTTGGGRITTWSSSSHSYQFPACMRADYSPRSPTLYRRNRLGSNPRQAPSSPLALGGGASYTSYSSALIYQDGGLLPDGSDCSSPVRGGVGAGSMSSSLFPLPLDITSTPSRGLSNATLGVQTPGSSSATGVSSSVHHHASSGDHLQYPHSSSSRYYWAHSGPPGSRARARRLSFGTPLTPSQDFFQHLHNDGSDYDIPQSGSRVGHRRIPSCPSPAAYRTPSSPGGTTVTSTTINKPRTAAAALLQTMTTTMTMSNTDGSGDDSSPSQQKSAKATRRQHHQRAGGASGGGASGLGIGFDGGVRLDGTSTANVLSLYRFCVCCETD